MFAALRDLIHRPGAAELPAKAAGANRLALVEEDEFEDWLNLSAVVKQIEAEILAPLHEFEQRYGRLVGVQVDRKNNPFGLESIFRTFQGVIQGLDFSNAIRAVLYKALGQALSPHARGLYLQLGQTLESLQPAASRRPVHDTPASAQPVAKKPAELDLAEIVKTLDTLFKQDAAGTVLSPESAEYSLDRILATLGRPQRGVPEGAPVRFGHQGGTAPGAVAAVRPDVLQVVGRLQHTARQLVERDAQTRQPGERDGARLSETSLRELLIALDSLPSVGKNEPGMPSLADQVTARIAGVGRDVRRLSPAYRQILDTTSELFNRAHADFIPSSDVDLLVKQLERPLLKLALQDPSFPASPEHPARQVLNLIEQYTVAADDKGTFYDAKLQRFLSLLVDRVCSEADADSGIFERVRDSLEKVLRPILQVRRTRVARLQEACEGRERIRSARTRVNAALEQRLAGLEVPGIVLRLLDAGWRQYLVLLEMRQGEDSEAWHAALATFDRLLARLDTARPIVSRRPRHCWARSSAPSQRSMSMPVCWPHSWMSWAPAWPTPRVPRRNG